MAFELHAERSLPKPRGRRRSRYGRIISMVRWITAEHQQLDKF